jgi:hypothetical protein
MVEELKTLGVEASVEEKTSDLQAKLDKAKAPPAGDEPPKPGENKPGDEPPKPPEQPEQPKATKPFLKGGVYHKGKQYDQGSECPADLLETFRALDVIEDRVV